MEQTNEKIAEPAQVTPAAAVVAPTPQVVATPQPKAEKVQKHSGPKKAIDLVFGKWDANEVNIRDLSLQKYVSLDTKKIPHTFGKKTRARFEKGKLSIVERLINKIMRTGQGKRKLSGKFIRGRGSCGNKMVAMHIVEDAFELVEKRTNKNPIQALVDAIENAGPREDTTRIQRGGVYYTVSVDVAPLKKVDEALKNVALAAFQGSFNTKTTAAEALAKELIAASTEDNTSFSVKRRDEVERIAKASR